MALTFWLEPCLLFDTAVSKMDLQKRGTFPFFRFAVDSFLCQSPFIFVFFVSVASVSNCRFCVCFSEALLPGLL